MKGKQLTPEETKLVLDFCYKLNDKTLASKINEGRREKAQGGEWIPCTQHQIQKVRSTHGIKKSSGRYAQVVSDVSKGNSEELDAVAKAVEDTLT